jgi:hypothetical protein
MQAQVPPPLTHRDHDCNDRRFHVSSRSVQRLEVSDDVGALRGVRQTGERRRPRIRLSTGSGASGLLALPLALAKVCSRGAAGDDQRAAHLQEITARKGDIRRAQTPCVICAARCTARTIRRWFRQAVLAE